jgi:tetratricopeptide (TPR) repeat protein
MFLTHVDEEGNSTPPVLIPNATAANRAVNIPEFVNIEYDDLQHIEVPAVDHYHHFQSARELLDAGKRDEAVVELRKALEVDPEVTRVHMLLGTVLIDLNRPEQAREHYERALSLDPSSPISYNGLGTLAVMEGRAGEANAAFLQAVERDPYFYPALVNLGALRLRQGQPAEALTYLERARAVRPRDPGVHRSLSQAYVLLGRTALGVKHLDHAAALDPKDVRSRTLLAWYLATLPEAELRDGQKALALAQQACEATEYQRPEPLDALAAAYAELGRYAEAVDTAARALALVEGRNSRMAAPLRARLALYREGRPYRAAP